MGRSGRAENLAPHWDSIPGTSSPYSIAIPTELPGPLTLRVHISNTVVPVVVFQCIDEIHGDDRRVEG